MFLDIVSIRRYEMITVLNPQASGDNVALIATYAFN
jgi:hypothetical protein